MQPVEKQNSLPPVQIKEPETPNPVENSPKVAQEKQPEIAKKEEVPKESNDLKEKSEVKPEPEPVIQSNEKCVSFFMTVHSNNLDLPSQVISVNIN